MVTVTHPEELPEDIPLYIVTPRGSSTDLISKFPWSTRLPWNEFCTLHFGSMFEGGRLLLAPAKIAEETVSDSQSKDALSKIANQGETCQSSEERAQLQSVAFDYIIRRSLSIVVGSEQLARDLFRTKSIIKLLHDSMP
jgi:hypothetical protein